MRGLFACVAALVMLVAPLTTQDAKPFNYKVGSAMTYKDTRFGPDGSANDTTVTYTVTKIDGDKNYLELSDGQSKHIALFSYADGFFCWGNVDDDGKTDTGLRAFKIGAKKGDTWGPTATPSPNVTLTFDGDEEVTVPGGKFTAKKVTLDAGGHIRVVYWFADKVGLVKAMRQWSVDGNTFTTSAAIELQKFVEAK